MANKPDKAFGFNDDRDEALIKAVNALTAWLKANVGAATKQDLEATEARIIKAFGERINPVAIKDLVRESEKLEKAVKANTPISGS